MARDRGPSGPRYRVPAYARTMLTGVEGHESHTLLAVEEQCTLRDVVQCGSLQRLLRVTAYVLKAVERFKSKPVVLTPQLVANSELLWITQVQKDLVQQRITKLEEPTEPVP